MMNWHINFWNEVDKVKLAGWNENDDWDEDNDFDEFDDGDDGINNDDNCCPLCGSENIISSDQECNPFLGHQGNKKFGIPGMAAGHNVFGEIIIKCLDCGHRWRV